MKTINLKNGYDNIQITAGAGVEGDRRQERVGGVISIQIERSKSTAHLALPSDAWKMARRTTDRREGISANLVLMEDAFLRGYHDGVCCVHLHAQAANESSREYSYLR